MHSNRYTAAPERKHRNLPRVLAATAAMLCIAALLLVLSVVQSHTAAAVRNRDGQKICYTNFVFVGYNSLKSRKEICLWILKNISTAICWINLNFLIMVML